MRDNRNFFYWLITICCIGLGVAFAQNEHLWETMNNKDATKISLLICVIFFITSISIGIISYRGKSTHITLEKLWFISDALVTLGMIGTVSGFMIMMGDSFSNINFTDVTSMQKVMQMVGAGIGTITVTTVAGLTSSVLLKLQLQFIDHMAVTSHED